MEEGAEPQRIQPIRAKIIDFQSQIVDLKREIRQVRESTGREQKRTLLEQIDWLEMLSIAIDDLRAGRSQPIAGGGLKALERLKSKMQRFFDTNSLVAISPQGLVHEGDGLKVIGTLPDPNRPEGTVLKVIRSGYTWKGQVLRQAEVVTVKNSGP
jgi:molecular chaperone GrpE (heat shock protein)